jgi:DNA-binding CsgD family transcriptional regulator
MLRGRAAVCGELDAFLDDVRASRSRALVLRGEAGIGKTVLLDYVGDQASGCRVVRAMGVESEMELPFAGLHQLCAPLLERVEQLPEPQRDGLQVAFGLRTGERPERLMVGLAVLTLLAGAAEERPVIGLVDDAHWLDRASVQTLTFVSRRLLAERVGLVFAVREPTDDPWWADLPSSQVEGLGEDDARALLASAILGPFDERVRERIIGESRGNPLALLELHRGMSRADIARHVGAPGRGPVARHIEQSFRGRLDALSPEARRVLLIAAADPLGDASLLWRVVDDLDLKPDAVVDAQDAELIEVGVAVRFRHPLVRTMVYRSADADERRLVHGALARATDPVADPDRRAWHRAFAAPGVDDEVADELQRSADRARSRGGIAAAAAFFERALELTADPARRGARAFAAAELRLASGALDRSSELVAAAAMSPHDELQGARIEHLRARLIYTRQRGRDAPALLLGVAQQLERLDPARAREVYLDAFLAAMFGGHLGSACGPVEVAKAARAAPPVDATSSRAVDQLFDALVIRYIDGYAAAVAPLERALQALRGLDDAEALRWMTLELGLATDFWHDETLFERSSRHLATARAIGDLSALTTAIQLRVATFTNSGDLAHAEALAEEGDAISRATGTPSTSGLSDLLAAWRARDAATLRTIDGTMEDATARGDAMAVGIVEYSAAVLHAGSGRYDLALPALLRTCELEVLGLHGSALGELVEAAVRTGDLDVARGALEQLRARTQASSSDWALGIERRAEALLNDGADADELYRESVERLGRSRIAVQLARSLLVHGEWLRRENRRVEARVQLRRAHEMFDGMGAEAFAERARRELLATGETARKRSDDTRDELTAQERQIAMLAHDGLTNPEIAAQLFLSARTVEWHLSKVFIKLGITSRRGLREAVRNW